MSFACIRNQLDKMHCKIKHFEELELIMEKEFLEIEELKECILGERIAVLQKAFEAGISKRWDHTLLRP